MDAEGPYLQGDPHISQVIQDCYIPTMPVRNISV